MEGIAVTMPCCQDGAINMLENAAPASDQHLLQSMHMAARHACVLKHLGGTPIPWQGSASQSHNIAAAWEGDSLLL